MHGSVFGYLRNRNFQAVNPFSTVPDPAYTRVQAGVAIGGAIKKDKTFYYFSYEGTRRQETGFSSIGANEFRIGSVRHHPGSATVCRRSVQLTPQQVGFLTNPAVLAAGGSQPVFCAGSGTVHGAGRILLRDGAERGVAGNFGRLQRFPHLVSAANCDLLCAGVVRAVEQS